MLELQHGLGSKIVGVIIFAEIEGLYEWNEIDLKIHEAKKLTGPKVHQDGLKPTSFLEWRSLVAFVR